MFEYHQFFNHVICITSTSHPPRASPRASAALGGPVGPVGSAKWPRPRRAPPPGPATGDPEPGGIQKWLDGFCWGKPRLEMDDVHRGIPIYGNHHMDVIGYNDKHHVSWGKIN